MITHRLTATATPRVQDDIAAQLGLQPLRFIHGFRRENIAIEVARLVPSLRPEAVGRLLADPARQPALVYVPTRRESDAPGTALSREFHALAGPPRRTKGKPPKRRPSSESVAGTQMVAALKAWRLAEARRAGVPAFRVLHDRTLLAIAAALPPLKTMSRPASGIL